MANFVVTQYKTFAAWQTAIQAIVDTANIRTDIYTERGKTVYVLIKPGA